MQSEGSPDNGIGRLVIWRPVGQSGAGSSTGIYLFSALCLLVFFSLGLNLAQAIDLVALGPQAAALLAATLGLLAFATACLWQMRDRALRAKLREATANLACDNRAEEKLERLQRAQRQLTQRYREAKSRAEAASRAKTAFLAHLSHDVRTPLNHIIGFADLLKHQAYGPLGDERYLAYVQDIKRSGERLLFSFSEILELAELESGSRVLQNEHIDVDEFLISLQDQFQSGASHCGVSLVVGGSTGVSLRGDRTCLLRMMANLLDNSLRYTPSGGKVSVMVWEAGDGVVLSVTDTGIGIPAERLEALSTPFALEDALVARGQGGMGLGLAIARTIAELSGGELVIQSTPAVGTTVAVSLPRADVEKQAVRPAA
ncbi:MAG TPA: HAMP domain-containing histidine kinase [Devosia sp.]|nr:HAMP domain-containing histidine kinase [Devosia sp.]